MKVNFWQPTEQQCDDSNVRAISHPIEFSIFTIASILSTFFFIIVARYYNSVRVFNRRIRTLNISNTYWICYFACTAARCAFEAVLWAMKTDSDNLRLAGRILLLIELLVHGLGSFFLAHTLRHQWYYRSVGSSLWLQQQDVYSSAASNISSVDQRNLHDSASSTHSGGGGGGGDGGDQSSAHSSYSRLPLLSAAAAAGGGSLGVNSVDEYNHSSQERLIASSTNNSLRRLDGVGGEGGGGVFGRRGLLSPWNSFILILTIFYMVACIVFYFKRTSEAAYIVFLVAFVLVRLPYLLLAIAVVTQRKSSDGPAPRDKLLLFVAVLFNLVNELPFDQWGKLGALYHPCALVVAPWTLFVYLCYIVSLVLFFSFLRNEYIRNMEECVWATVSCYCAEQAF